MARNGGPRSSRPAKQSNGAPVFAGIMAGVMVGLAAAAGIAWYIYKRPAPFNNAEKHEEVAPFVPREPQAAKPAAPAQAENKPKLANQSKPANQPKPPATDQADNKRDFKFYHVLTDEEVAHQKVTAPHPTPAPRPQSQQQAAVAPLPPVITPPPAVPAATASDLYFVQAGSFSNVSDADNMKARLALLGLEASIQTVTLPTIGVRHRVRLGPYTGKDMNKVRQSLSQNGVESTSMHAQSQ